MAYSKTAKICCMMQVLEARECHKKTLRKVTLLVSVILYVVGSQKDRLNETVLLGNFNIDKK